MRVAKSTWWVTQCIFEMGSNLTQLLYCRFFQSCKDQMYFHIPIAVLFPVYSTFASSANILFFSKPLTFDPTRRDQNSDLEIRVVAGQQPPILLPQHLHENQRDRLNRSLAGCCLMGYIFVYLCMI
jgi:hypothetical protein